jgi:hypothetical protein
VYTVPDAIALSILPTSVADSATGDLTWKITIGWNKQDGIAYTLYRAPLTTVAVSYTKGESGALAREVELTQTTGDFVQVGGALTADASGRYTVIDTPATRKAYRYRLVATVGGVVTNVSEGDFANDPFTDTDASYLAVVASTDTAYANQVTLTNAGDLTGLTVELYRAPLPAGVGTAGDYTGSAEEDAPFELIETAELNNSGFTYLDQGLTIDTKYIYRHVIKAGTAALIGVGQVPGTGVTGEEVFIQETAGIVAEVSVPVISTVTNTGNNGTTYYFRVDTPTPPLLDAQVQLQSRSNTLATASPDADWSGGSIGTVKQISPTATAAMIPTGSGLSTSNYYFTITEPTAAQKTANAYRLVTINRPGSVSDPANSATAATGLVDETSTGTVGGW